MNPEQLPPPAYSIADVPALIEALHETGRRLEELTAGEVDAVADRRGQPFLLRRAQDHMRESVAIRQAAILNALPAQIALLDAQGHIVAVNATWQRSAIAEGQHGPGHEVGADFLRICEDASGADASQAHQVAAGIRSVLAGVEASFSIEYSCRSSPQERWFLLTASPLQNDAPDGAVLMHQDVTAAKRSEQTLRNSELRFRQMAENIRDVFFLREVDSSRILYVSPAYEQIWGRSCESLYAQPESWADAVHPDDREAAIDQTSKASIDGGFELEYRIVRPDGTVRWIESKGFPVRDNDHRIIRIAGIAEDITERKEAQTRIMRLNRVYAVLSGINSLIMRVRDRGELFKQACRLAVEEGRFKLAWIGIVDPVELRIIPAASAGGDAAFFKGVEELLSVRDDASVKHGVSALAAMQKQIVVVDDVRSDPRIVHPEAHLARGIHSLAFLPLTIGENSVAVLGLYAAEAGFFDAAEMKLLRELAGDIAFAIDHIAKQERLDYLSYYDVLTGLANRSLFQERLAQHIRSAASGRHKLALFLIDLERFKSINDSLGKSTGDAVLRQVATWLTQKAGDASLLTRLGADHFAVVLPEVNEERHVTHLVEKWMRDLLKQPFHLDDAVLRVAARVGAAIFPDDGDDADILFANAEAALKKAKASGERYLFYTQAMTATSAGKLTLENQLRQALDREEFVLHYQPKVNLQSGKLAGAEALIRWNDPRTGLVPPGRFIPVLEETGLIYEAGRWALRQAIADYLRWRAAGLPAVRIAVNVSPLQLRHRDFIAEIEHAIGIDVNASAGLELEITESLIMEDVKRSIASLQALRAMGVTIAIDDFGTGFSSLSYLSKLPVDTLKIDQSFVIDMTAGPEGLALVATIISLAQALNLKVVAEGVETAEQSRLLRLLRCDEMQGFLFSRAVPYDVFEQTFLASFPAAVA